jgi:3-hydroxyacyl-[acyl-carrier-protein] dehydratase
MSKILDINQIRKVLPHGHPFILIDRVLDYKDDATYVHAIKNVTYNEPYFQGHFPAKPIMPGALIIEAMAQAIGALNLHLKPRERDDELFYLAGVDATRFRKIVSPGDCLHMKCTQIKARQNLVKFDARAFVDDVLVCSAELILVREKSA